MHLQGDTFDSPVSGVEIHRQVFLPEGDHRAGTVILLHGLGDHLGCHLKAAELFCERGFVTVGIDWPGHGRSGGRRGHIAGLAETSALIDETVTWTEAQSFGGGDAVRGIYAHSTGAFALLHHLGRQAHHEGAGERPSGFDWIWLGSPLLRPDHGQNPFMVMAGRWLGRLAPSLTLDTKVRPDRCRHPRPEGTNAGREMDGCHHWVNAAFGGDLVRHARGINRTARAIAESTAVLLTQGGDDPICPPAFSKDFFENLATQDKRYLLLPGMRHEILREADNEDAIDRICGWLDERAT